MGTKKAAVLPPKKLVVGNWELGIVLVCVLGHCFFVGGMIQLLDGFWGDSTFEGFGWIFDGFPFKKIPGCGFRHISFLLVVVEQRVGGGRSFGMNLCLLRGGGGKFQQDLEYMLCMD